MKYKVKCLQWWGCNKAIYEMKWQMYCGCFGPLHFLYAKWQRDYNAYTTRSRIKNARDKWRNEIFIYAAYRITYTHTHTYTYTTCVCVKSEHTNHVQHINKCALCWAFKLKTSRLHGLAETIWEWNPFAIVLCAVYVATYPAQTSTTGNTGRHWTVVDIKYITGSLQGIFPFCCTPCACCFYFCFVCSTATTMIAICKKRNAFGVHLHTNTHTHTHAQLR